MTKPPDRPPVGRVLLQIWGVVGLVLLGFGALEAAYVGQRAVRAAWFGSDEVRAAQVEGHPYRGQAWYRDFLRARERLRPRYDPWRVFWAYPTASRYLNVDSAGRRRTVQPPAAGSSPRVVYFLGGSAMWGYTSRDSLTIPSLVAARLRERGLDDVTLVNLAQPAYTAGQELASLVQELRAGGRPSLVVFYDGINDIRLTLVEGEPGHVFFEDRFRRLFEVEARRGMFASVLASGARSKLIGRLALALGLTPGEAVRRRDPTACHKLGAYYADLRADALALGRTWGFEVLLVQQPNDAATDKPLTPFERGFRRPDWINDYARECSFAIDSALAGDDYRSFLRLFDGAAETVFLDRFGHVTEAADGRIAAALADEIVTRLGSESGGARTPPRRTAQPGGS